MYAVVVNIAVAELSTKKTFQSTEKETLMTLILFFLYVLSFFLVFVASSARFPKKKVKKFKCLT